MALAPGVPDEVTWNWMRVSLIRYKAPNISTKTVGVLPESRSQNQAQILKCFSSKNQNCRYVSFNKFLFQYLSSGQRKIWKRKARTESPLGPKSILSRTPHSVAVISLDKKRHH